MKTRLIFLLILIFATLTFASASRAQEPSLAQRVFDKHSETLLREDVITLLPEILDRLKTAEIDDIGGTIDLAINLINAGSAATLQAVAQARRITLTDDHIKLLSDPDVQALFQDEDVRTLLQDPAAIDELAGLLLEQMPVPTPDTEPTQPSVYLNPPVVASPAVGEELIVSLEMTGGEDATGYEATVNFDPTAIRFVSLSNAYLPAKSFAWLPSATRNSLRFTAGFDVDENEGEGTLAVIRFEVVAVKASTVRLSDVILTGDITATATNKFRPPTGDAEITVPEVIAVPPVPDVPEEPTPEPMPEPDTTPPVDVPIDNVHMPDPNLAAAVRTKLGLAQDAPITKAALQRLTGLEAGSRQIRDLTGLEHATQLTVLWLYNNEIVDISALSELRQLTELSLWGNGIKDIRPLSNLRQLTKLWFGSNPIEDIRPLSGLTKLTELSLHGTYNIPIVDISALSGLRQLAVLLLGDNFIVDLSPLSALTKLTELDLSDNSIVDISPLAGLTQLAVLWLRDNSIVDIRPLLDLVNLEQLRLAQNPIENFSPLCQLLDRNPDLDVDITPEYCEDVITSEDVNKDGEVDVRDLVLVAANFGLRGERPEDVNGDGVVNIDDLILVAVVLDDPAMPDDGMDDEGEMGDMMAAAPSLNHSILEMLSSSDVKVWLSQARQRDLTDPNLRKGILFLEQLLASLIPKETALLANYPNPFNPETWIPYHLAKDADVTLQIYAINGRLIRTLALGHQPAGMYQDRSRAAYWDGKNAFGEPVASGLYFYTLTAGDFVATRKMLIRK